MFGSLKSPDGRKPHQRIRPNIVDPIGEGEVLVLRDKTGDLGDCEDLPEDSMIIPTITSTNDNCLGKECPSYTDCFVLKARKRAMDSDIVVVNHHLFLADLAIKETGFVS